MQERRSNVNNKENLRLITFNTYKSLKLQFSSLCKAKNLSMTLVMQELVDKYLKGEVKDKELNLVVNEYNEKKEEKITFYFDSDKYETLKNMLSSTANVRPASLFSFLIKYYIEKESSLEAYRKQAEFLKEHSAEEIRHIVYEIKYYVPVPDNNEQFKVVNTQYLIDMCTEERFKEIYQKASLSPLIYIGAVHKP